MWISVKINVEKFIKIIDMLESKNSLIAKFEENLNIIK